MKYFINWILGNNKYLVTVSHSKHGGNYYPLAPKSKQHSGPKVSNQWSQMVLSLNNPDALIEDVEKIMKKKHPKTSNIKIESIVKL